MIRSATPWLSVALVVVPLIATAETTWPQWRGTSQDGVAPDANYPTQWNEDQGINWKIELPGRGGSTPVISGSTAYLTSGIDDSNTLLAIDVTNGETKWKAQIGKDAGGKHKKGSGSNPSPVTDGNFVFAYFRSGDLGCVDLDGRVVWKTNLQERYGSDSLWWDLGSSPTLTDSAVVVAVMQTGPSYLIALDKKSGEIVWKIDRMLEAPEEAAQSYSTPVAVQVNGTDSLAVLGADHVTLHDANTGKEMGRVGGFNPTGHKYFRSISSPAAGDGILVCPYARGTTTTAIRLDDLADGSGSDATAWLRDDVGSDVPTPAISNGRVYVVGDAKVGRGKVQCLNLETGETIWSVQIPKSRIGFSSSPLLANGHLYVTQEDATTHVIGPIDAEQPRLVSSNSLEDSAQYTVASLVPVDDDFLLRTKSHLYRIGR